MIRIAMLSGFFAVFFWHQITAQISFQKKYNSSVDEPTSVIEVPEGYLITGFSNSLISGHPDALLLMVDHEGELLWHRLYGDILQNDRFTTVTKANDGGFLAVGSTFDSSPPNESVLIVHTDDLGNLLWSKTIEGSDFIHAESVISIPGGYVISGRQSPTLNYWEGFVTRIDNQGNTLWSKYFDANEASETKAKYAEGNTLYVSGHVEYKATIMQLDLSTGDIISRQVLGTGPFSESLSDLDPTLDDQIVYSGRSGIWNGPWVRKATKQGNQIWSKIYVHEHGAGFGQVDDCSDGGYLLMPYNFSWSDNTRPVLAKLDGDGNIVWSYDYGTVKQRFIDAIHTQDGGFLAVGIDQPISNIGSKDILLVKTKPDGLVDGCCTEPYALEARDYAVPAGSENIVARDYYQSHATSIIVDTIYFNHKPFCAYQTPLVPINKSICPGESVVINGIPYQAPATVFDTVSLSSSCDTVFQYNLTVIPPQPAQITIQCPPSVDVDAAPGAQSATVSFDLPVPTSDCFCNGIAVQLDQGLASGSSFPIGETQVCYRATDYCGTENSCCFRVTVHAFQQPVEPCDEKSIGCLRYELRNIDRDASGNHRYRFAVVNQCNSELQYVALGAPEGVYALEPASNPGFVSGSGRIYAVRNPNFSPFNSVRFTHLGTGFAAGASDEFEYTLPARASTPLFIRALVRLENGQSYDAYLNTFNCPVGVFNRSESGRITALPPAGIIVYPNPASDRLFIDHSAWPYAAVQTSLYDAQGRLQQISALPNTSGILELDLTGLQAGGLYGLELLAENGKREFVRFMVLRP